MLRQAYLERVTRNPRYSLRALARDLQVSHTYLSLVMHGHKPLSASRALQIGQVLGWDQRKVHALLEATERDAEAKRRGGGEDGGRGGARPRASRGRLRLELDRFRVMSDWYHLAILDLTTVKGFRADEAWVAKVLGLRRAEVEGAVRRLRRLGLLEVTDAGWRKTHTHLSVPARKPSAAIRKYHAQMIERIRLQLEESRPGDFETRDVTGSLMAIDARRIPEAKRRIARFRRRLIAYLTEGEANELYQLNVQLFRLTRKPLAAEEEPQ
jgi:uncharacterized protein (TIGR02147 family)